MFQVLKDGWVEMIRVARLVVLDDGMSDWFCGTLDGNWHLH
jgi:hypothetical protein